MAIQVTLSDLTQKVQEGWKRDALAEHYGLPKQQMSALLKDAGLKIRKFHAPKWELIDDTQIDINEVMVEGVQEVQQEPAMENQAVEHTEDSGETNGPGQDW